MMLYSSFLTQLIDLVTWHYRIKVKPWYFNFLNLRLSFIMKFPNLFLVARFSKCEILRFAPFLRVLSLPLNCLN